MLPEKNVYIAIFVRKSKELTILTFKLRFLCDSQGYDPFLLIVMLHSVSFTLQIEWKIFGHVLFSKNHSFIQCTLGHFRADIFEGGVFTDKTGLKIFVFINALIFAFTTFVKNTPLWGKNASKV